MEKKIKVIYLTNILTEYNIPILDILGRNVDLTIAHSGMPKRIEGASFKEIILHTYNIGVFTLHKEKLSKIVGVFDVLLITGDIKWLSYMSLVFRRKRKYRICFWGIGVSASYTKRFDEVKYWDSIRYFIMRRADTLVFYSDYPIKKYIDAKFNPKNLFVAPNTVQVSYQESNEEKNSILFIGTIYKSKNIYALLENYYQAFLKCIQLPILNIIGGGEGVSDIVAWIKNRNLDQYICMYGEIYDEDTLQKIFSKAIACISPGQAGLSVLKSMGYGVPFITMENAYTGGERLNIINHYNGILYAKEPDLESIILDISANKSKYLSMGNNARNYYLSCRKPIHMAQGLFDAILGSLGRSSSTIRIS